MENLVNLYIYIDIYIFSCGGVNELVNISLRLQYTAQLYFSLSFLKKKDLFTCFYTSHKKKKMIMIQ